MDVRLCAWVCVHVYAFVDALACVCVHGCVCSFNHLMAIQMSGGGARVRLGPSHPLTLHPDLDWLEQQMGGRDPPKVVVITNPCNPVRN
jgi:hypothetical protein